MTRSKTKKANSAAKNGQLRKRRRHRAERRAATREVREKINQQRRDEDHPGWVEGRIIAWVW